MSDEALNDIEKAWIDQFAELLAQGWGSSRTYHQIRSGDQIRSGVFRGAVSTFIDNAAGMKARSSGADLFELGRAEAERRLSERRLPIDLPYATR